MKDFYHILGVPQTASAAQIRAAFKRLAMQYHPDKNPNDPTAEEIFKRVNEAYHTLSDPLKKARYDSRFYTYETQTSTQAAEEHWREVRRKQYQARRQYTPPKETRYDTGSGYFKIQGLAFVVFIIMSGISFGIIHLASFLFDQHKASIQREHVVMAKEASVLFGAGKIDEAITKIIGLHRDFPMENVFRNAHDSLVNEINRMADENFEKRYFKNALYYYQIYKKYQERGHTKTLEKIAVCQQNTGLYTEMLQTLKQLHSEKPWSLELIYQIATLNLNRLDNTEEALFYLNLGEKKFRDNLTDIYGDAFMVMLDPKTVPDLYYEIFILKADIETTQNDFTEAGPDLELAIYLRPARPEGYVSRANLYIAQKKYPNACADLRKAKSLGAANISELQLTYCR